MRTQASERLLGELRRRGARRLRRVTLRRNRSTIWSLTQGATTLNLHEAFARAPGRVLDALAVIARDAPRDAEAIREARRVVREWPGLTRALEAARLEATERRRLVERRGDGDGPTDCCATPEQRRYLRRIYRYFNETRFGGRLPATVPLRLSNRMRTSLGHMLPGVRPDGRRYVAEIALNVDLMLAGNGPERVDTLLHEMAHAADWLFNGNRGHGPTWKAWARKARCRPDREYRRPVKRRRRRSDAVTRVPPLPPALRRGAAA